MASSAGPPMLRWLALLSGRLDISSALNISALKLLGWNDYFHEQMSAAELEDTYPGRVIEVHRGELIVSTGEQEVTVFVTRSMIKDQQDEVTVGDWLLLSLSSGEFIRLLDRSSLIRRLSVGDASAEQMVAANIDTLFIVTSCNDDFNLSRLERYLAFAYGAEIDAVIVLTKIDTCDNPSDYEAEARTLGSDISIGMVNAHDEATLGGLKSWCKPGQTVALLGSSGVGKSTLVNALGAERQKTGAIREDDSKGRHTTTHRSLLPIGNGALLLDSPGIRSLGVVDSDAGLAEVFKDVITLTNACRFSDCQHEREPGCAIKVALGDGSLSERRLENYKKLTSEQEQLEAMHTARRKKDKAAKKAGKKGAGGAKRSKRKK